MPKFAEAIRQGQGGETLEQYARRLGVSRQTLLDWRTGRRTPVLAALPKIARVLHVEVTELVG